MSPNSGPRRGPLMATLAALLEQRVGRVRQPHWPPDQYLELHYGTAHRALLHRGQGISREINLPQLLKESAHLEYEEARA